MKSAVAIGVSVCVLPFVVIAAAVGAIAPTMSTASSNLDIPANMMRLYVSAAHKFAIPASLLAAIGKVECDHYRNPNCGHPNSAGAEGPMQFLPATFASYSWASGNANPSPYNEEDAVFAAAAMLRADGVNQDKHAAIFAYNHSEDYVQTVLGWAAQYAVLDGPNAVVEVARSYLGVPYLWGGTSRAGIDCSGLVMASYAAVGVTMPRVAQDQSRVGVVIPSLDQAMPGDLLSYGSDVNNVDHIAIYSGAGQMIEAPRAGTVVREVPARSQDLVVLRRVIGG